MRTLSLIVMVLVGSAQFVPVAHADVTQKKAAAKLEKADAKLAKKAAKLAKKEGGSAIPELDPTALSAAAVLLLGGAAAVTGRRRRKLA